MMTTDRDQIIERLSDVASALDTRDWHALGELFTESATGYGSTGRQEIITGVRQHLGGCGPSQHLLGNHRVELAGDDEDHARSRTYVRVDHAGTGEQAGLSYECFGEYTDEWTRTSEGWQINSRVLRVDFTLGDRRTLQPG